MKIAAFDLGTTWACVSNIGYEPFHVDLNPNRRKPKLALKRPAILGEFATRLSGPSHFGEAPCNHWLAAHDVIVHSQPFARGQAATRLLWGMAGILEAAAHNHGCAVMDWTDGEIKKWAAGHGKASKEAMIAAAQEMGYCGDNEHEADAFCLLKMAEEQLTKGPTS